MKALRLLTAALITALSLWAVPATVLATADAYYQLSSNATTWDGTAGNRLLPETVGQYQFDYGDDGAVSFTLPWPFTFYGQPYTVITADTNGNIWFGATTPQHSFPLATSGPVISAWNNDLSSYYSGGVFIEHKTAPERVVVHWRSETFADAGFGRNNDFAAILFADGTMRIDYATFDPHASGDFGSGLSRGNGTDYLPLSGYGAMTTLANRSFRFDPDLTPPALTVVPPPPTNTSAVTLNGTMETGAVVNVTTTASASVGEVTMSAGSWSCIVSNLAEGDNFVTIRAADAAGNVTDETVNVVYDIVPPALTVNPPLTPTQSSSQVLSGLRESGAMITVNIDTTYASTNVSYPTATTWEAALSDLQDGDNTMTVTATDAAQNRFSVNVVITYLAPLHIALEPSSIAADERISVQIDITHLGSAGNTVYVEQIIDANHNGLADAVEPLIRAFAVTDGVTSANAGVPGDEDGASDGQITTGLNYHYPPDQFHAPGEYLFRVSTAVMTNQAAFSVRPVTRAQAISGTVTDGTLPIRGAQVQLTDKWNRPVAWAISDGNGEYRFDLLNPGGYRLTPVAPGYAVARATLPLVEVASGASLTSQDLTMIAGNHHLRGQIIDAVTGKGIPGIGVETVGGSYDATAKSNILGFYELVVPDGTYDLQLALTEDSPALAGYPNASDLIKHLVLPGDSEAANDFVISPADVIVQGIVIDSTGNPLPGLPVQATLTNVSNPAAWTLGDAHGRYALSLRNGDGYTLEIDNFAAQSLGLVGTRIANFSTAVGPLTGNDLTAHEIDAWVAGIIKRPDNTPVAPSAVTIRNPQSTILTSVTTATDGSYRLGLFSGSWYVQPVVEVLGYLPIAESNLLLNANEVKLVDFVANLKTQPDLIVTEVPTPQRSGASEQTVRVSAIVRNQGGATIEEKFTVNFYLSRDQTLSGEDIALASVHVNDGLAAASEKTVTRMVKIPKGTANGLYYLLAKADAENTVLDETSEENNVAASPMTLTVTLK